MKRTKIVVKLLKLLFNFVPPILLAIAFAWSIKIDWEKEERRECLEWQRLAKEIKVFYLTPWQKEQCDHYGIEIDAPVKGGTR